MYLSHLRFQNPQGNGKASGSNVFKQEQSRHQSGYAPGLGGGGGSWSSLIQARRSTGALDEKHWAGSRLKRAPMGFKLVWERGFTPAFLQRESRGRALHYPEQFYCHSQEMGLLKKKKKTHITQLIQDSKCPYSHTEDPKPRITVLAVSPPQFYQGIVDN